MAGLELAIRTAMTKLGASLTEQLLGADSGYEGLTIDCGAGHRARFVSNRVKTFQSVLGPIERAHLDNSVEGCAGPTITANTAVSG
ncbi:MAG: hypothetical protein ACRDYY_00280 [Acidimicrobiales bacterium]